MTNPADLDNILQCIDCGAVVPVSLDHRRAVERWLRKTEWRIDKDGQHMCYGCQAHLLESGFKSITSIVGELVRKRTDKIRVRRMEKGLP